MNYWSDHLQEKAGNNITGFKPAWLLIKNASFFVRRFFYDLFGSFVLLRNSEPSRHNIF